MSQFFKNAQQNEQQNETRVRHQAKKRKEKKQKKTRKRKRETKTERKEAKERKKKRKKQKEVKKTRNKESKRKRTRMKEYISPLISPTGGKGRENFFPNHTEGVHIIKAEPCISSSQRDVYHQPQGCIQSIISPKFSMLVCILTYQIQGTGACPAYYIQKNFLISQKYTGQSRFFYVNISL